MDSQAKPNLSKILTRAFLAPVKGYRFFISPLLGSNCRFHPSCSSYTIDAIESYGLLKGGYLSVIRLLKCHPWHTGGFDPVPNKVVSSDDNISCHQCTNHLNNQHSGSTT